MRVRSTAATARFAALVLGGLLATSCSGARDAEADAALVELGRAADALSATALRPGAERAFAREGHPVPGGLTCGGLPQGQPSASPALPGANRTAGAEDVGAPAAPRGGRLEVRCTGRTEQGAEAVFEGRLLREALAERAPGDDSLPGSFTGAVDGARVFSMDCLQCAPAAEDAEEAGEPVPGGEPEEVEEAHE